MKRWITGLLLVLLACVPIFLSRSSSPSLLADTDTAYLLLKIRERQDPLSWFAGDWPLGNHFYRPVSTLSFEIDNGLYATNAAGYGLTNALLAIACVLLLFWFLRELTDNLAVTTLSSLLFAYWHWGSIWPLQVAAEWLTVMLILIGLWRHGLRLRRWLPGVFVLIFLTGELGGKGDLYRGVISWLPGRTASVMAVFVLLSVASYARYERLSAEKLKREPTPLDPPATKGTQAMQAPARHSWLWAVLSVLALLAALGSYEQAVMAPALLLGTAVTLRLFGYRVRWAWQVPFWGALVLYLVLRHQLVPGDASSYQLQALRSGNGMWLDLANYFFPGLALTTLVWSTLTTGPLLFLVAEPWLLWAKFVSSFVTAWEARRRWKLVLSGWALSFLAFMPMAWLQRFEHYHYLPMALRAFFVVAIGWVALDWLVIAASRPELQAPSRPSPAPGSLPRP
ncbi:MAG TPA: hypothetical protein VK934_12845 [Fimbriimonas sp.]|nr:hypothetical protein [Fimbriimonas sp.]